MQSRKLNLPGPAGPYVLQKLAENRISSLPISLDHLLAVERLPFHHRDPFDRLMIAQSVEEDWPIITADPKFKQYPVQIIW